MGSIKSKKQTEKTHILTGREWNYLKILTSSLMFHTWKDKIISGFLYEVCNLRFRYPEDCNLIFEIDLDDDKQQLKVREVPTIAIENALNKQ